VVRFFYEDWPTGTTETYYCRKDPDPANSEVLDAFAERQNGPSAENPLIEPRTDYTGYA